MWITTASPPTGTSGRRACRGRRKGSPRRRSGRSVKRAPGVQATGPSPPLWDWKRDTVRYCLQAARTGWGSKGYRQWRAGKHALLPRLRQAHRPAPARPVQKILQATPAAARGGQNTPRRFITAIAATYSRTCACCGRHFRRMETATAGIARTPAIFQTVSTRQGRTGVQLSNRYLDIRPPMSDV